MPPSSRQKVAEGTVCDKEDPQSDFPRCVEQAEVCHWLWDSLPVTSQLSRHLCRPQRLSLEPALVPVAPEATAHQNSKSGETTSKQSSCFLILAADSGFPKEKHGSCQWPSNRFARPRNKPCGSFLHHWNKRRILPSGKAHIAVKQIIRGHLTPT